MNNEETPRYEFDIELATWYRGHGTYASQLLRHDGRKCCLGFHCLYAGLPSDSLLGKGSPSTVARTAVLADINKEFPEKFRDLIDRKPHNWDDNSFSRQAMDINDALATPGGRVTSDKHRQQLLKELFWNELKVRINFV